MTSALSDVISLCKDCQSLGHIEQFFIWSGKPMPMNHYMQKFVKSHFGKCPARDLRTSQRHNVIDKVKVLPRRGTGPISMSSWPTDILSCEFNMTMLIYAINSPSATTRLRTTKRKISRLPGHVTLRMRAAHLLPNIIPLSAAVRHGRTSGFSACFDMD